MLERELSGHRWDVKCVHWHPYKPLILSGSKDNKAIIYIYIYIYIYIISIEGETAVVVVVVVVVVLRERDATRTLAPVQAAHPVEQQGQQGHANIIHIYMLIYV